MKKKIFAVIGLGRFGSSVATSLYEMGCEVLAVDSDMAKVQDMKDSVTHAVQADAMDEDSLRELGIKNFDVVIVGITQEIQASILITLILKDLGVGHVVAKAQNALHGKVLYKIGADKVVFPERDMGNRVAHNLVSSNILDYIELSPDYSIIEVAATEKFIGKTLIQLDLRKRYSVNVVAIKRNRKIMVSPSSKDQILEGDVLVVIGSNDNLRHIEKF